MSLPVQRKRDLSHLTKEEIEEHASQGITILYDFGSSTVKRYPGNYVIKSGPKQVREAEFAALRLAEKLGLPTPRAYEINETSSTGNGEHNCTIRMDFIEGQTLDLVWPTLSANEKIDICRQLRDILDTMRKAEWPADNIGACNGGPVYLDRLRGYKVGGPFKNEEDLNRFIFDIWKGTARPIQDALKKHQRAGHRIVFSHGDLHQGNIMVKDGKITGLIDWEVAGWYPEYWDYIQYSTDVGKNRDWTNYAKEIFSQVYDEELVFMIALAQFY